MVRTKLVAVLLGPSGVGLVGLYVSATSLVGVFAGLGISTSGIREVAEAYGSGDEERVARTVITLRRACWITGVFGWLLTIFLSYPLSLWTFGSGERTTTIALLGAALLLNSISAGQSALLQGARRIAELAWLNVTSVAVGSIVSIGIYACLGPRGILPVILATALVNLVISWFFSRRVTIANVHLSWWETWRNSQRLIKLGFAFMWSGLLTAVAALTIQSLIIKELGLDANGVYQAAWAISGMFAGFILGAMGTDFYPRLTAASHDHVQINRLINEQTEIGMLLSVPGLLSTLAFAPWVLQVFYSEKFINGADLLPWFVLGIFGQVISWPMGLALVAAGAAGWYFTVECFANLMRLSLSIVLLRCLGLSGVALAVPILYALLTVYVFWICNRLFGFRMTKPSVNLLLQSGVLILAGFAIQSCIPGSVGMAFGLVLVIVSGLLSIRGLATRLGLDHRIVKIVYRIPGGRLACTAKVWR